MSHNIKPGVAAGDEVQAIFNHAKANGYALPAVNVIGSDSINAVMETAATLNSPVIILAADVPRPLLRKNECHDIISACS